MDTSINRANTRPDRTVFPPNRAVESFCRAVKSSYREVFSSNRMDTSVNREDKPSNRAVEPFNREVLSRNREDKWFSQAGLRANRAPKPRKYAENGQNREISPPTGLHPGFGLIKIASHSKGGGFRQKAGI